MIRAHRLPRARRELGHLHARRSRTSRSTSSPTRFRVTYRGDLRGRQAAARLRRDASPARATGHSSSRRSPSRRPTSSPTAPASSCCTRSRAWPVSRSRSSTSTDARRMPRFPDAHRSDVPVPGHPRAVPRGRRRASGPPARMEGDTFEMEDQRNWSDASYKTYVRPLAPAMALHAAQGREVPAGGPADGLAARCRPRLPTAATGRFRRARQARAAGCRRSASASPPRRPRRRSTGRADEAAGAADGWSARSTSATGTAADELDRYRRLGADDRRRHRSRDRHYRRHATRRRN